jgi:hypothetical protein
MGHKENMARTSNISTKLAITHTSTRIMNHVRCKAWVTKAFHPNGNEHIMQSE